MGYKKGMPRKTILRKALKLLEKQTNVYYNSRNLCAISALGRAIDPKAEYGLITIARIKANPEWELLKGLVEKKGYDDVYSFSDSDNYSLPKVIKLYHEALATL